MQEIQNADRVLTGIEIIDSVMYLLELSNDTLLNMKDINTT